MPVYLDKTELTPELALALHRVQALHRSDDPRYQQHLLNALGESKVVEEFTTPHNKIPVHRYAGFALVITLLVIGICMAALVAYSLGLPQGQARARQGDA